MPTPAYQNRHVVRIAFAIVVGVLAFALADAALRIANTELPWKGQPRDFYHFYHAASAMRAGEDIYASGLRGYIYPPLVAFVLQPLALLPELRAEMVWLAAHWMLLAASLILGARVVSRGFGLPGTPGVTLVVAAIAALVLGDKLRALCVLGQTDGVLIAAFVAGLWLAQRRSAWAHTLGGLLLGLAAGIKYLPLLLAPYLWVRGRARASAALLLAFALTLILPALSLGWDRGLHAARVGAGELAALAGLAPAETSRATTMHPIDWSRSVSVPSASARALGESTLTPGVAGLVLVTAGLVLLIVQRMYASQGVPLFLRKVDDAQGPAGFASRRLLTLEWAALVAALLIFGPQTTSRHMAMALPIVLVASSLLLVESPRVPRWGVLAALVLFGLGLVLPAGGGRAIEAWRGVGGSSWTLLLLVLACTHATLASTRTSTVVTGEAPDVPAPRR